MKVPLLDFSRQDAALTGDLRAAFERVLASGQFIMGPEVEALERECASYLGGGVEAIGLSSGTDAILLALMALGIGPGDEVICPAYTFFATAGCVSRTGATPVFVDVLPGCFTIDPSQVAARITPKTKAIIPVHLFGQSADLEATLEIANRHRIPVIEDAAQAIGTEFEGRAVGTLGLMGCYSFFPTKNLGALGDGGLLVTPDRALGKRLRALRNHGMHVKYHHESVGGNFRLDALQAAFLRAKLPRLDAAHEARRANAALYDKLFAESALPFASLLLPRLCRGSHIYNQYVIRLPAEGNGRSRRDALRQHLADQGVTTEIYYPIPLHLQECFAPLGYRPGSLPVSEALAQETLALPIFPELRPEEIAFVVREIATFLKP
ncbi:dTDP-4-amino-4,6-dideoxygalactose transaminase [Verrucomicrobium sp. GAS474]|uniref:DegT/DnrJ/EryC1/StrS family aminotransferase n=1 Tax=Verrucomicrobium sp. GAS474 TaxID=1882831 RepID=UPI00087B793B|nr:DegT/DnrJ/EryC1/StrS family aminotransferase [Verrucomicrobium sp. GAS474]SDU21233.1 dTDP-4-amino-4,6-dideoxygalactose transaminase [Verrucomicrobium sp. GAS474]